MPEVFNRLKLLDALAAILIQQVEHDAVDVVPVFANVKQQPPQACDLDTVVSHACAD